MIRYAVALTMATMATSGGFATAAPRGDQPIYAVVRVGSALSDEDRIGVRRAGFACLPNGVIRWSAVATGGTMDQREVVQDALEDAGLPVTPLGMFDGSSRRSALRLRATIRAADFRLCARRYLGDAKAMSGDAALDVDWRVESSDGREVPHSSHIVRRIEPDRAASIGSIYRQLLGDAARDAAEWLRPGAAEAAQ